MPSLLDGGMSPKKPMFRLPVNRWLFLVKSMELNPGLILNLILTE